MFTWSPQFLSNHPVSWLRILSFMAVLSLISQRVHLDWAKPWKEMTLGSDNTFPFCDPICFLLQGAYCRGCQSEKADDHSHWVLKKTPQKKTNHPLCVAESYKLALSSRWWNSWHLIFTWKPENLVQWLMYCKSYETHGRGREHTKHICVIDKMADCVHSASLWQMSRVHLGHGEKPKWQLEVG